MPGTATKKAITKKDVSLKTKKAAVASKTTTKKSVTSSAPKAQKENLKSQSLDKTNALESLKSESVVVMSTSKEKSPMKDFTGIGYLGIPAYSDKTGEEYMCIAQREHFRQILWAWKKSLMEEVDRTVSHMKEEAASFADLNDRASQEEEFSLELRTRDRERKLIKKIDEALERLEHEDYGYCDGCGIEIGIRRLEARPTATLCIDCKTLDEIREKQLKGG